MDFRIKFRPRKYTIKAQSLNYAYYDFLDKLPALACFTCGTRRNGSKFSARYNDKTQTLYIYNVEVFKRGKHRKNKHYDFYLYTIPMGLLDMVKMDIKQNHRNFTIKMP